MTRDEIIRRVFDATPEELGAVEAMFEGADRRVMSVPQAALALGKSPSTVRRMLGRKELVNVPNAFGERQVLSKSITDYLKRPAPVKSGKRYFSKQQQGSKMLPLQGKGKCKKSN
jgi:hypothetical protein